MMLFDVPTSCSDEFEDVPDTSMVSGCLFPTTSHIMNTGLFNLGQV